MFDLINHAGKAYLGGMQTFLFRVYMFLIKTHCCLIMFQCGLSEVACFVQVESYLCSIFHTESSVISFSQMLHNIL